MVQIAFDSITKQFPSAGGKTHTTAVDKVSLTIPSGALFFLLGPSGCGKTTLLRMIAGFIRPTAGRILFDDQDVSTVPPHLRDTGMVFQSYALWPHMTVADNVAFGLDARHIKNPDRARRVDEALALVQMAQFKDRKPNQLSGGQQQRVALARALTIRPKCLLLDEPLSNLDAGLRLEMRSEIRRIVKQSTETNSGDTKSPGMTAVYVTHDQKEALALADSIAIMRHGKIEQVGTPAELYRRPNSRFVAGFIGESNFITGKIDTLHSGTLLIQTPAGPIIAFAPPAPPAPANAPPSSLRPGQPACLAFRPEAVQFPSGTFNPGQSPRPSAHANRLQARHLSTTYLGDTAEHILELAGGQRIKALQMNPREHTHTPGENITITVEAENLILVQDDPS